PRTADAFVSALPVWALVPLLPPALTVMPFFARMAEIPVCGAIAVQLWFDRKVVGTADYTLVANTRAVVYQEQSTTAYPSPLGRISVDLAPADDLLDQPDAKLVEMALATLRAVQPDVAAATVVKSV